MNFESTTNTKMTAEQDDFIEKLLERIPEELCAKLSSEHLTALKLALGAEPWATHSVDIRDSIKFWRWRFYFVFVAGRERRMLSQRRYKLMRAVEVSLILGYLLFSTLLGLLALYLLKSALDIDMIPGFSTGIWDWFKNLACHK